MSSSENLLVRTVIPVIPLAALPAAAAQVIHTDIADITLTTSFSGAIYLDVDGRSAQLSLFSSQPAGYDFSLYFVSQNALRPYILHANLDRRMAGEALSFGSRLFNLDEGESIGSNLTFAGSGGWINKDGTNDANWAAGSSGFLGFRFISEGVLHYGWAQITYGADQSLTLHDFAYEASANTAIPAGAVPEPATSSALAGLLAGSALLFSRRCARGNRTREGIEAQSTGRSAL